MYADVYACLPLNPLEPCNFFVSPLEMLPLTDTLITHRASSLDETSESGPHVDPGDSDDDLGWIGQYLPSKSAEGAMPEEGPGIVIAAARYFVNKQDLPDGQKRSAMCQCLTASPISNWSTKEERVIIEF